MLRITTLPWQIFTFIGESVWKMRREVGDKLFPGWHGNGSTIRRLCVGTDVGTRCVFWCFRAFFYEYLRAEKGGKYKKNQPIFNVLALNIGWFGGVREIWTLAAVSHPTPLAGAPLRPLEYYSTSQSDKLFTFSHKMAERMGFEPMVRSRESLVFKTSSINHSDTSPQWLPPECRYYYTKNGRGCQPLPAIFF